MPTERTALLIRCSREEAGKIREMAKRERRTVSGYVFNIVMTHIKHCERILRPLGLNPEPSRQRKRRRGPGRYM